MNFFLRERERERESEFEHFAVCIITKLITAVSNTPLLIELILREILPHQDALCCASLFIKSFFYAVDNKNEKTISSNAMAYYSKLEPIDYFFKKTFCIST